MRPGRWPLAQSDTALRGNGVLSEKKAGFPKKKKEKKDKKKDFLQAVCWAWVRSAVMGWPGLLGLPGAVNITDRTPAARAEPRGGTQAEARPR